MENAKHIGCMWAPGGRAGRGDGGRQYAGSGVGRAPIPARVRRLASRRVEFVAAFRLDVV